MYRGQISEYIFAPNGGYCVNHPSNIFRNAHSLEITRTIPNIQSRDAFSTVAREQKYLMDYQTEYAFIQVPSYRSKALVKRLMIVDDSRL